MTANAKVRNAINLAELNTQLAELMLLAKDLEQSRVDQLQVVEDANKLLTDYESTLSEKQQQSLRVTGRLPKRAAASIAVEDTRRQLPELRKSLAAVNVALADNAKSIRHTQDAIKAEEERQLIAHSHAVGDELDAELIAVVAKHLVCAKRRYGHSGSDPAVIASRVIAKARSDGKLQTALDKAERALRREVISGQG